ncbi:hypothetical protein V1477_000322 [Vespula maculifrons]|uniref:Uncharacterized protein n=1 Tax=Vespula maculifrons TaxID=7453 RepID=A0ABD2D1C3_VESMC
MVAPDRLGRICREVIRKRASRVLSMYKRTATIGRERRGGGSDVISNSDLVGRKLCPVRRESLSISSPASSTLGTVLASAERTHVDDTYVLGGFKWDTLFLVVRDLIELFETKLKAAEEKNRDRKQLRCSQWVEDRKDVA